MSSFTTICKQDLEQLIQFREGETKWGEKFWLTENSTPDGLLSSFPGKAVLLGIPEDFGVRANRGIGGTQTAWWPVLKSLINMQYNEFLQQKEVALAGSFDFTEWGIEDDQTSLSSIVEKVDDAVFPVIQQIVQAIKVPIIIGGGHNNAYPIIKGTSKALMTPLNVINIDAHADFRNTEVRHSGNGFRFAKEEGYLQSYFVLGLQENYNNAAMLQLMREDRAIDFITYESIGVYGECTLEKAVQSAIDHCKGQPVGIEIDVDAVAGMLSSAATPTGFSYTEARRLIHLLLEEINPVYVHIAEAAESLADGRKDVQTIKAVAILISDVLKKIR